MCIPSITMLYEKPKKVNDIKGSSLLSTAHGRVGARATSFSFCISVSPPFEKIAGGFQQAGKKKKGCGAPEAKQSLLRGKNSAAPESKSRSCGISSAPAALLAPLESSHSSN